MYHGEAAAAQLMQTGAQDPGPELARIISQLEKLNDRVWTLGGDLARTADALFGERPTGEGGNGPTPARSGAIGRIEEMLDAIESGLSKAAAESLRLSRVA